MTRFRRLLLACALLGVVRDGNLSADEKTVVESTASVSHAVAKSAGLCLLVGIRPEIAAECQANPQLLIHALDRDAKVVQELQERVRLQAPKVSLLAEHWQQSRLPHADNLANLIVVAEREWIDPAEIMRVLCPGGIALTVNGTSVSQFVKPVPSDTDDWTHQWHAADGGLVTNDKTVGVPQGIQWLSGPLFAMAGRKTSTQSLVSAGGINFYLTQNVLQNVSRDEKRQYLEARDAFNGLILWERPWVGPYTTGDGETNARMVATAHRVYLAGDNTLLAVNTRTGETLAETKLDAPADKLLFHENVVLVQSATGVTGFDANLKLQRWKFPQRNSSGLVARGNSAYFLIRGRSPDGHFKHELVRLEVQTGEPVWRMNTQPQVLSQNVQINFVQDGYIALQSHGHMHLFSAEDGQHLWSHTTEARPGKDYSDERFVGHFYRQGLVWMHDQNSPRKPNGQSVWVGRDPKTGDVVRELTTRGEWPRTDAPAKIGCQLMIASDQYIMIPRQATYIDLEIGNKLPFKFVRGGCGLGFVPANGLVYSHPHACGCFSEAVRGFLGMHSIKNDRLLAESEADHMQRLQVFSTPKLTEVMASSDEWPIYRGDGLRSGVAKSTLPVKLRQEWSTAIATQSDSISAKAWKLRTGNVVTAPTIAGDSVFVADVDQGRLLALNLADGHIRWMFQANGRIDSPPTLYRGLCLFGSHDGYVYGLDAENGRLVWKFRAAPVDRRIVVFGNVESTWPVAGSILVHNGLAYAAAGRAPDADGGIAVHALDPVTGTPVWSSQVEGDTFRGLCDYLIAGDDVVYLANWQFDAKTGKHGPAPKKSVHLQGGKVGLLESSWTKHDLALRKEIQTWTAAGTEGQLLAFSPSATAVYDAESRVVQLNGGTQTTISIAEPQQVTSMILTRNQLILSGGRDRADTHAGGFLRTVDLKSGQLVQDLNLPAEPVFDGIGIARGRIFVATQDGQLHAFGATSLGR